MPIRHIKFTLSDPPPEGTPFRPDLWFDELEKQMEENLFIVDSEHVVNKVYIVRSFGYDDCCIDAVFTTMEKAEEFVRIKNGDLMEIDEIEINPDF